MSQILAIARKVHREYQAGELSQEAIASQRPVIESQLQGILDKLATGGWPVDAQRLANRIKRHWHEWFTLGDREKKPCSPSFSSNRCD